MGKKRLISNFTVSHTSRNQYTEQKKKVDEANICYVKITVEQKIQAFLKTKKMDKRKNIA